MHELKQLIQSPTSAPSRVSQEGAIIAVVPDHQLIFCPRKTSRSKTGGAQKYFNFHSLKNYTADCYREALKHIDFPNYKNFGDVNEVDSNLTVIDKIASYKSKPVKGNNQKLFDGEVLEKLNLRNKLFKTFKKSKLHIIKNYIKNQNRMP